MTDTNLRDHQLIEKVTTAGQGHVLKYVNELDDASRDNLGVVFVAGGEGTRQSYGGPKGNFPIGPVTNKSVIHLQTEKILAVSCKYGVSIPGIS